MCPHSLLRRSQPRTISVTTPSASPLVELLWGWALVWTQHLPQTLISSASVPSDPSQCRAQLADPETRTLSPPGKPGHRVSVPAPRAGKPHLGMTPGFPKSLAGHSQGPGDPLRRHHQGRWKGPGGSRGRIGPCEVFAESDWVSATGLGSTLVAETCPAGLLPRPA